MNRNTSLRSIDHNGHPRPGFISRYGGSSSLSPSKNAYSSSHLNHSSNGGNIRNSSGSGNFSGNHSGAMRRSFQRSGSSAAFSTSASNQPHSHWSSSNNKAVVNKGGVLSSSGSMSALHSSHSHGGSGHTRHTGPGSSSSFKGMGRDGSGRDHSRDVGHGHGVGRDGSGEYTGHLVAGSNSNPSHAESQSETFRNQVEQRQQKPKIIFLDVDGVLHSVRVTTQNQLFNSQKMALLRKLIAQTDSQIVLSSAWRRTAATLRMAYAMLNKHGIATPIDVTPDYGICGKRSSEILTWVDRFQITKWVAIDDLDLLTGEPRLRGHFLKCNPLIGLTNELVEEGTKILNGK